MTTANQNRQRVRVPAGSAPATVRNILGKAVEQIEDALDVAPGADLWNDNNGNTPSERTVPTGDPLRAAGDGAAAAVRVYSDTTEQGGMARMYAEFSRMLEAEREENRKARESQNKVILGTMKKNADLERALQGLATVVNRILGISQSALPIARAATEAPGPVERDAATEDDEDKDDLEKAIRDIQTINVKGMLDAVSGLARQGATPPDLTGTAVRKSGLDDDAEDGYTTTAQSIARATLRMREQMVASGAWPASVLRGLPNSTLPQLRRS